MRPAKIWKRKDRPGWFATIGGKKVGLGKNRDKAQKKFHALKSANEPIERSAMTVAQLVELYLLDVKADVKATTWANYDWYLQRWNYYAGRRQASTLRPFDVTTWAKNYEHRNPDSKIVRTWNPTTQRIAIAIAKQWSRWCKRQGYLDDDPLAGAKAPQPLARKAAEAGAIEKCLTAIDCDRFRDVFLVMLDTACRPGEIRTLEAKRINWKESTAIVTGKMGERKISLTSRSLEILWRLASLYPDGPLLRNKHGRPWKSCTLTSRFQRLSEKAKVNVVAYQLRHDFWLRAHKAGVGDIVIARQLGHKDLSMLMKTYAHVETAQTKDAVERAMGGPIASTSEAQPQSSRGEKKAKKKAPARKPAKPR